MNVSIHIDFHQNSITIGCAGKKNAKNSESLIFFVRCRKNLRSLIRIKLYRSVNLVVSSCFRSTADIKKNIHNITRLSGLT